jgi:predicted amidohydrolase
VNVAVVQSNCRLGDKKANLQHIKDTTARLGKQEVDIVCFPELVTTGYALDEKWFDFSEPIIGQTTEAVTKIAREHGTYLIFGMPERDEDGKRIYDSAVLVSPEGRISGVYRKVHLWATERTYFTAGDRFPIFKTKFGNIGIGICYDMEFPEPARIMAVAGADLIFFPSAQPNTMWRHIDVYAKSRAAENCVFVAFSDRVGQEGKLVYLGRSQVVSPSCKVLSRVKNGSGFATAHVDFQELKRLRSNLPYLEQRIPAMYGMLQHTHGAA